MDYFHSFEPDNWTHFTDLEFLSGLTYDDERKIFSYEYGDVINGEATRVIRRLPGYDMLLLDNTFVDIRTRHGKDYYHWWEHASGAMEQDYTIDAMYIPVGKGIGVLSSWVGKALGKGTNTIVKTATPLTRNSVIEGLKVTNHVWRKSGRGRGATEELIRDVILGAKKAGTVITENGTGSFSKNVIKVYKHNAIKVVVDETRRVIVSASPEKGFKF